MPPHKLLCGLPGKAFFAAYGLRIEVRSVSNPKSPEAPPVPDPLAQIVGSGRMYHTLVIPDRNIIFIDPPMSNVEVVVEHDRLLQPVHDLARFYLRQTIDTLDMVAEAVDSVPLSSVSPGECSKIRVCMSAKVNRLDIPPTQDLCVSPDASP